MYQSFLFDFAVFHPAFGGISQYRAAIFRKQAATGRNPAPSMPGLGFCIPFFPEKGARNLYAPILYILSQFHWGIGHKQPPEVLFFCAFNEYRFLW